MSGRIINSPESEFRPTYIPHFENPNQFIEEKLKILQHLGIIPTNEEINHLYELKTEGDINAAVKTIINNHWK